MADTNDEIAQILDEVCFKLESMTSDAPIVDETSRRRSILDPSTVKMRGPRTTATSPKVDRRAAPSRTKMVDAFQTDVLGKLKSPGKRSKKHNCPFVWLTGTTHRPVTTSSRPKTTNVPMRISKSSVTREGSWTLSFPS